MSGRPAQACGAFELRECQARRSGMAAWLRLNAGGGLAPKCKRLGDCERLSVRDVQLISTERGGYFANASLAASRGCVATLVGHRCVGAEDEGRESCSQEIAMKTQRSWPVTTPFSPSSTQDLPRAHALKLMTTFLRGASPAEGKGFRTRCQRTFSLWPGRMRSDFRPLSALIFATVVLFFRAMP